ncbi:MAG: polyphosphate kinase 1, partial [Rhodothermales bacterium]
SDDAVYGDADMIDFSDLKFFAGMGDPNHRYPDWDPVVPPEVLHEGEATDAANIFSVIRNQDVLVHHPYESFKASTQRFIEEASQDPDVLAIKQTLYRTSEESPIVEALIRAAERGKHVAVLVEVKARFDEQSNMEWGQMLEKSGVHVTYGVVGLKTHCKTTLVMRSEEQGPRPYCHIGTGNYNPTTAHLYTDVGLLTCDEEIGADVVNLFHFLTGYAPQQQYRRLLIAPRDMRGAFVRLLRREARHCRNGRSGRVIAKMNALDDVGMIQELYRASQAGVHIDLIVRGHCRLRPQLSGFSDNIRVRSIIGRFLEHSRIYYFENAGTPDVFIGSADWQRRNLDDRVEAIAPVTDAEVIGRLSEILTVALEDRRSAWQLQPDGTYIQLQPRSEAEAASGLQDVMMRRSRTRYRQRARL